jgi:hypothetical protein
VVKAHPRAVEYVHRLLRGDASVYDDVASTNPIFAPEKEDGWISTKTKAPPPAPRRGPPQPAQRGPPPVARRGPPVAARAGPPAPKRAAPPAAPRAAKRPAPPAPRPAPPARQTPITGKRVALVGVLTQSRPRASSRVAAAGGTVAPRVDEGVSFVVLGDNLADGRPVEESVSFQAAQRLGIKLLSEHAFFAML